MNVTREAVELVKSLCVDCQRKRKRPTTKGVVVQPILTNEFSSRGQVDLIDMQSLPSGKFKWIMVYQDHLTKFCIIRALSSKRASEVAYQLMDIFLMFGAPQVLQSDNGSEFTAAVVKELMELWTELVIVHGKPRHPQSQGIKCRHHVFFNSERTQATVLVSSRHHIQLCLEWRRVLG